MCPSLRWMEELERLVATSEVRCRESLLSQNPSPQVSPLADLAIGSDLSITRDFVQSGTKLIDLDVHGSWDVARSELLGRPQVKQERLLLAWSSKNLLDIHLGMLASQHSSRYKSCHVDRVFG